MGVLKEIKQEFINQGVTLEQVEKLSGANIGSTCSSLSGNNYKSYDTKPEVAYSILSKAGIYIDKLNHEFNCPFHDEGKAKLYYNSDYSNKDNASIVYHDKHKQGGNKWFTMPELYSAVLTGKLQKLDPGVGAIYWIRCLHELGYIETKLPDILAKPLPEAEKGQIYHYQRNNKQLAVRKNTVDKVYNGFKYLLQLRTLYNPEQKGTPFSWRFASRWCNTSSKSVQKAMRYLMQQGFIRVRKEREGMKANILDIQPRKI